MNTLAQYDFLSSSCSKAVTKQYSTSFYSAIQLLGAEIRTPICSIYGLVRLADEIVDTFHDFDKQELLEQFKRDTFSAIHTGISLNPILQSFQAVVRRYNIDPALISDFFASMEKDLSKGDYLNEQDYNQYIYGSAEVVGLMCLHVFCDGNREQFDSLKKYAQALGAAFQKVNFLRDLKSDIVDLNRSYFPNLTSSLLDNNIKRQIEEDIARDFALAFTGIKRLPLSARFGVYVAYKYYLALFNKMKRSKPEAILESRVRIPNHIKMLIVVKAGLRSQLNLI